MNVLRTGGFAGLIQAWEVRVEEQPNAQEWVDLVDSCPWEDPEMCQPGADRFVYEVSAGPRSATLGEQAVQGPWRQLVEKVREDGVKLKPTQSNSATPASTDGQSSV